MAEGELEMSTTIPDFKGKHDTKKYLCKKKLGDIVNLIEAQKEATRKVSRFTFSFTTILILLYFSTHIFSF